MSWKGIDSEEANKDKCTCTEGDKSKPCRVEFPFPISLPVFGFECCIVLGFSVQIFEETQVADDIGCINEVNHKLSCLGNL